MFYTFLRLGAVPLIMIGWVIWQAFYKKKSWQILRADILYVILFLLVYWGLYRFFTTGE